MESAAAGLIAAFQNVPGWDTSTEWSRITSQAYNYGAGGISCWGTLCGVPNGCVALLNLIGLHGTLGHELLGYYSETDFPTDQVPNLYNDAYYGNGGTGSYAWNWQPVPDGEVKAHTKAFSPLCHVSISKWCRAAGVDLNDTTDYGTTHKNDRCGKICADLAAETAQLINYYALNAAVAPPAYTLPDTTASCKSCHFKTSDPDPETGLPKYPAQCGQMDCVTCHNDVIGRYMTGKTLTITEVWAADGNGDVETQFQANDPIQYHVRFILKQGLGGTFVKTKYSKAIGPTASGIWTDQVGYRATENGGEHHWYWVSTVPSTAIPGAAQLKIRLMARDYLGAPELLADETKKEAFTII